MTNNGITECALCPDESGIILPMLCYNQLSSGGPVVIKCAHMGPMHDPCDYFGTKNLPIMLEKRLIMYRFNSTENVAWMQSVSHVSYMCTALGHKPIAGLNLSMIIICIYTAMLVIYLYNKYKIMIEANRPYVCNCPSLEEQHQPRTSRKTRLRL